MDIQQVNEAITAQKNLIASMQAQQQENQNEIISSSVFNCTVGSQANAISEEYKDEVLQEMPVLESAPVSFSRTPDRFVRKK